MAYISPHAYTFKNLMGQIYGENLLSKAGTWEPPALSEGSSRYLWTDAFGVINFITLAKIEDDPTYLDLAKALIRAVHDTLGKTRDGTRRLKGATDEHILNGGLRIGKKDESGPDGDGQYHHYLTLWMFALNRFSVAAKEPEYNNLAIELAKAIHPRFIAQRDTERPKVLWKLSMELADGPLVDSEGNLDPMDGYTIFKLLQKTAIQQGTGSPQNLAEEIAIYWKIVEQKYLSYHSTDTLDLGMALWISHWLQGEETWANELSKKAFTCLSQLQRTGYFSQPQADKVAFRDFGTALGLRCYDYRSSSAVWEAFADQISDFWNRNEDLEEETPEDLKAITLAMYAAGLEPGAFRKDFL